jgi:hypothetical protein
MQNGVSGAEGVLTTALRRVVEHLFPGVAVSHEAAFWPMYSIDTGELSTAAAIEVARATKCNAQVIADQIVSELRTQVDGEWRNDRGYIVGWGFKPEILLSEVDESVSAALQRVSAGVCGASRRIHCLIPDSTEPTYARIRLIARAAMQGLLAVLYEGRAELALHPLSARSISSAREVVGVFREAVLYVLAHESESRLEGFVPAGVEPGSERTVTVWTTHHFHERLPTAVRNGLSQARVGELIRLVMPLDGWLRSRDRALLELLSCESLQRVVNRLTSEEGWYRFLFHAASTVPSGDFDPAVSLFEECSSPLWSLRLLMERFKRFSAVAPVPFSRERVEQAIKTLTHERKLSVQALLLPVYTARAVTHAEVAEWCEAIERICQRGHAFINAPRTRLALERGTLDEQSCEIAASLGFGLSSILPVFMEDACRDQ